MQKTLEQHIIEMRQAAESLVQYSFPNVAPEHDQDVNPLKTRQLIIDGYDVLVTFCVADFKKYRLENIQIHGVYTPFLPFVLVCKIARQFLGSQHLSYEDFVKDNRKVYCWTIRKKQGRIIPMNRRTESDSYEGLTYSILKPGK
jgi:hypothetical protein